MSRPKKAIYYTNIFDIFESSDGGLYVMPPSFSFTTYVFDKRITDRLGIDMEKEYAHGITPNEAMELYQNGVKSGKIQPETTLCKSGSPRYFDWITMQEFINAKDMQANFDSPEFIEHLKLLNTFDWPLKLGSGESEEIIFPSLYTAEQYLFSDLPLNMSEFGKQELQPHESSTRPIFVIGNNETLPCYPVTLFAIPRAAKNPELAWEYLKFMISKKDIPEEIDCLNQNKKENLQKVMDFAIPYASMPINRNNCRNLLKACWGQEVMEKYDSQNMLLNSISKPFGNELDEAFHYIRASFFTDHSITAEECAKQMQERAEMFVNE